MLIINFRCILASISYSKFTLPISDICIDEILIMRYNRLSGSERAIYFVVGSVKHFLITNTM